MLLAMLVLALAAPALAQGGAADQQYTGGAADDQYVVEEVVATGVLEKPEATSYGYGTHAMTDGASGALYALQSESVDLDAHVGGTVTVYGTVVPGYENGGVEGGPPLVEVSRVEPAEAPAVESVRGVITAVSGGSVTVEGSSTADDCGTAVLELGEETEIFFVRGGTIPATADDLRVGQTVEATYAVPEGPRTLECPQTYEALEIFILPDDGGAPPGDPGTPPSDDGITGDGASDDVSGSSGGGGSENSSSSSSGDPALGEGGVLPDTGGVAPVTLGAGALLFAGALLVRRIFR